MLVLLKINLGLAHFLISWAVFILFLCLCMVSGTCLSLKAKASLIQWAASSGSLMRIINMAGSYISPLLVVTISLLVVFQPIPNLQCPHPSQHELSFQGRLSLTLHQKPYSNVNRVLATALSSATNFIILLFTTSDLVCLARLLYSSKSCCFICIVLLCRYLWGMWHLEVCLNICCWGTMWPPTKLVKWGKWHNSSIHRLREA